jgi:hypothetical protein
VLFVQGFQCLTQATAVWLGASTGSNRQQNLARAKHRPTLRTAKHVPQHVPQHGPVLCGWGLCRWSRMPWITTVSLSCAGTA